MKNFKKIFLVTAMVLCLGGGIGATVAAFTNNPGTGSGTGDFDTAINLYWDSESTTKTLANCSELVVDTPAYRYLAVSPKSSKSVAGTVTVTFTMAASDSTHFVDGVTITVYALDGALSPVSPATEVTEAQIAAAIGSKVAEATVNKDALSDDVKFSVTASTEVHETNAYYGIKVVYDGTLVSGKELGGQVTIAQSFAA